jgi:hypothetical protein
MALVVATYVLVAMPGGATWGEDSRGWLLIYALLAAGILRGNRAVWMVAVVLEGTFAVVLTIATVVPWAWEDLAFVVLMLARTASLLAPGTRARMQGRSTVRE